MVWMEILRQTMANGNNTANQMIANSMNKSDGQSDPKIGSLASGKDVIDKMAVFAVREGKQGRRQAHVARPGLWQGQAWRLPINGLKNKRLAQAI